MQLPPGLKASPRGSLIGCREFGRRSCMGTEVSCGTPFDIDAVRLRSEVAFADALRVTVHVALMNARRRDVGRADT